MRQIKFRAWDGESMIYPSLQGHGHITSGWILDNYDHPEQFTGLHDKNGTEIYDGDILGDQHESIGLVAWNQDTASWLIDYVDDLQHIEDGDLSWAEIIGNIHSNPELLNP